MKDLEVTLTGGNLQFVEGLYAQYLDDPQSLEPDWRAYFDGLAPGTARAVDVEGPRFVRRSIFEASGAAAGPADDVAARQDRVDQLVRAYRVRGHMVADLDPLGLQRRPHPELELGHYDFNADDLDQKFSARTLSGPTVLTLREILDRLKRTYCGPIGTQFMHIDDLETKMWLQQRMESSQNQLVMTRDQQLRVLTKLTDAEIFEQFIHKKFLGAKRFSLEGGESLIPLIDQALEKAGRHGIDEAVIGMAHRGRLNVLANIINKSPAKIFREFADADPDKYFGGGDVKYHMGYSSDHVTSDGHKIHLSLCFNPSHLEFVDPVLVGRVRAKQDRKQDPHGDRVLPLLIHGDAAFAGQGIVQETLNLSELPGHTVGGTVHLIVNNQIGFTTPPEMSRSSFYATDVAKMLQVPIFHVNGEHPEAVAQVIEIAMDFRRQFKKDVVIDMWCYRRYGHNESDDPAFTQPVMYAAIRKRKSVRAGYTENLLKLGEVTQEEADEVAVRRRQRLEDALSEAKAREFAYEHDFGRGLWRGYLGGADAAVPEIDTAVARPLLDSLMARLTTLPESFTAHPKIGRLLALRQEMVSGERPLDWGAAEALAFASLLEEGTRVRLSGQDSGRGTFSHRHARLYDYTSGAPYVPLSNLSDTQAPFDAIDSALSESGVLGFEYGYSLDTPDGLVLWEAQFGDFVNGAQVIIDQFIISCEDKWNRLSGLVMLLPHGFEGQGPEHSSGRLERFLSLCAEDNIQVCNLTTPAQYFHCLRRQVRRPLRKPLIIMTPKSLLRLPEAVSDADELATGRFQRIIPDPTAQADEVRRVLLCSGKIYFDLLAAKQILGAEHVAIHRIEQLYPLPDSDLADLLAPLAPATPVVWVQEEPQNQGAWPYMRYRHGDRLLGRHPLTCIARVESASPATGSAASHRMEQELIIERAFELA